MPLPVCQRTPAVHDQTIITLYAARLELINASRLSIIFFDHNICSPKVEYNKSIVLGNILWEEHFSQAISLVLVQRSGDI